MSSFSRSDRRDRKMKTSPAKGSAASACVTSAARESMPFRKSTGVHATMIRRPAQGGRLTAAGHAGDQGEAAVAGELLDPPAERFQTRGDVQRLGRHVGRERVPFEAAQREHLVVHEAAKPLFNQVGFPSD
jgi:hypothetical protein